MRINLIRLLYKSGFFLFVVCLFSCQSSIKDKQQIQELRGSSIGTYYQILYIGGDTTEIRTGVEKELAMIMKSCNYFDTSSTLSHVNTNQSKQLDSILLEVLTRSLDYSRETEGAFDVSAGRLIEGWGFGRHKEGSLPDSSEVDQWRKEVGYEKIQIKEQQIEKPKAMLLNLGAVAKGYAVDRVAQYFTSKGIDSFLIEIGGEVYAKGQKPNGQDWLIGISMPDEKDPYNQNYTDRIQLNNRALATSGNYRNYYQKEGKKFVHTISPFTGFPVQNELLSVSVVAEECAMADAFATAMMVKGLKESLLFLAKHQEIDAYLIYLDSEGNMKTFATPGFEKRIVP